MGSKAPPAKTVDEYIAAFPADVQSILQQIRATIRRSAPDAEEAIKYQIPTYTLYGNLISFAAYQKHIGLYPAPSGTPEFNQALALYRAEKATVRFPLDQPIPYDLISQMVALRVQDNRGKAEARAKKR